MKLKKQQLEEERLAVIERDNRMLLEKMSQIMRSGGRVDDRNLYEHRSLNKEKREKELLRVAEENKVMS
jgi:E3 ubiquitin-protein ligase TRIP12